MEVKCQQNITLGPKLPNWLRQVTYMKENILINFLNQVHTRLAHACFLEINFFCDMYVCDMYVCVSTPEATNN